MALGKAPDTPRIPGPKWWQANTVSIDKAQITDMCHDCGHVRDLHARDGNCLANVDHQDPTAHACSCKKVNHWVKAEVRGITL
jgi:hypothetical protein